MMTTSHLSGCHYIKVLIVRILYHGFSLQSNGCNMRDDSHSYHILGIGKDEKR